MAMTAPRPTRRRPRAETHFDDIRESAVSLDDVDTRVLEVSGDGPPLLLLHGFTDSADTWRPLLRELQARGRRAVAVDLPSSGWATPLRRPALPALDSFVTVFVRRYADSGAILAGNSLGGYAALRVARHTELPLLGVVPISPGGLAHGRVLEQLDRWGWFVNPLVQSVYRLPVPGRTLRRGARFVYEHRLADHRTDPQLARFYASHLRSGTDVRKLWSDFRAFGGEDVVGNLELSAVAVPVLMIWGQRDRVTPVVGAQLVLAAVPDSRLVVLEDCGHCAQVQAPAEVAELMVQFGDRLARPRRRSRGAG